MQCSGGLLTNMKTTRIHLTSGEIPVFALGEGTIFEDVMNRQAMLFSYEIQS